jgi:hypothetical protein
LNGAHRDRLGAMFGVNGKYIKQARFVLTNDPPAAAEAWGMVEVQHGGARAKGQKQVPKKWGVERRARQEALDHVRRRSWCHRAGVLRDRERPRMVKKLNRPPGHHAASRW